MRSSLLKLKVRVKLKKLLGKKSTLGEIALSMLPGNANIIEAGAHVGWDTVTLAGLTTGTVYAFEPVPHLYQQLVERTKHLPQVQTFDIAIGNINGPLTMYVSLGNSDASSSLLKPKEHINTNPDVLFSETITVEVKTVDEWAKSINAKPVNFMWLDMQGFELEMLKHAQTILPAVTMIYTEVASIELYESQGIYAELKQWLETKGFKL